jgi:membrane protease YdiL (CAAX protease family)
LDEVVETPQGSPETGLDLDRKSRRTAWLGVVEAVAVLLACVATIVLFSLAQVLVQAPRIYDLEFDLHERESAGSRPISAEDLMLRVETHVFPGTVETRETRGRAVLLISGLDSAETVESTVNEILIDAGYVPTGARVRPNYDAQAMLVEHPALTLGLQAVVLILFGFVFYRRRVRPAPPDVRAPVWVSILTGLGAGIAAFVCAMALSLIQHLLGWSVEEQAWLQELLRNRDSLLTLIPLVVLIVPFAEEVFFRGYFFRFLHQRSGAPVAYLLSAGCFSLIHFHLPGLATYFLVGLLFAVVCNRTRSLTAPVVGHMTYNGLVLAVALTTTGL